MPGPGLSLRLGCRTTLLLIAILGAPPAWSDEVPQVIFPRTPAPSPDGSWVAFCHQGDLWVVPAEGGDARRLTSHPANERLPRWSPDGNWIAFVSDRDGNDDLFIVPPAGGEVRRLTWYSGQEEVTGWTPDSKAVLFQGRRQIREWGMEGAFMVPVDGGAPVALLSTAAESAVLAPDGRRLAYVRGATPWWRRGYEGSARTRLWLSDLGEERAREGRGEPPCTDAGLYAVAALHPDAPAVDLSPPAGVTGLPDGDPRRGWLATYLDGVPGRAEEEAGCARWPQWFPGGDHLLYWSEHHGVANLKMMSIRSGARVWVTRLSGGRLRYPALSADGRLVAFELEDGIYTLPLPPPGAPGSAAWTGDGPGEPQRLEIRLPIEGRPGDLLRKQVKGEASEFALSPDGEQIAFVCDGEIFARKAAEKEPAAYRITDSPARDDEIAWDADSRGLVFVSDRDGERDLYRARSADPGEPRLARTLRVELQQLTDDEQDDRHPRVSPDGKRIAFQRGRGDLMVMNADGSQPRLLSAGLSRPRCCWSPDSRWLAFDREDDDFNADVYVVPADGSAPPVNISRHPDDDYAPHWSADGRQIAFVSRRTYPNQTDIWMVWLARADEVRSREERLEALAGKKKAKDEGGRDTTVQVPEVRIEFERIHERLHRLTTLPGAESQVLATPDGKGYLFVTDTQGQRDLWWIAWDGTEPEPVTRGGQDPQEIQFDPKGEKVYYRRAGTIACRPIKGGEETTFPCEGDLSIDRRARRGFIFDEAWRALDADFYDPHHHGVDWHAVYKTYRPWALGAVTQADFQDVLKLMIGELNASHLNVSGGAPDWTRDSRVADSGDLGVLFTPERNGTGLRIARVLADSPADRDESRLAPGDVLLAIDGVELVPGIDPYRLLEGKVERRILLRLRDASGEERAVAIRPISLQACGELYYREEVAARRAFVEERGAGRVAYIHVEAMNTASLDLFERDLYAQAHGREALIIDVRGNGGGSTTDLMLTSLMAGDHAVTRARGGGEGYPHGRRLLYAWTHPIVVLCNEHSFSNAEIFAWSIQALKRGPVIGQPTHGGVISTGGTTLADGSWLRLPFRGWTSRLNGANLEGTGCRPDIVVENHPDDLARGIDRQLERAVAEAQAQVR